MGARSQSHTAVLFVVEGYTGCSSAWSRSNMAAISVPSREERPGPFQSVGQMAALCFD